ncbi:glutamate-cysteine ligase family protein, partial [Piscicoccus intestinalis]|uniref:glutamate-cysteine ligase family protein n=1 Tax=Piscicoccus intestinalis TaxID=746033 RepID=UPI0008389529
MPKITAHSVGTAAASARPPRIRDTDEVHRRIAGICFKTGPPHHRRRLGAETEWIVVDPGDPAQPVDPDTLHHLQTLIGPPPCGSRLTIEPGGQVELSSQPAPDAAACLAALGRDVAHLTTALAATGLALAPTATDAWSLRPRLLDSPRYRAMETYFDALGEHRAGCGRAMMRATASLQVNLETGADAADIAHRWRLLHDVGPTLVAAFANSPRLAGERTGWVSTRQAIWRDLDPPRTHAPADLLDPAAGYATLALDAPLMFVRDGDVCVPAPGGSLRDWIEGRLPALRPPEPADLDAHLTTLFPPVRARGFFEVRYLDTQPPRWWPVPVVVLAALADHRDLGDRALAVCRDVNDAWDRAARDGVRDPALGA